MTKGLFGCFFFITQFPSLNFRHSSLINLKYPTRLAPSLTCHHSIFFILFMGPIPITRCSLFIYFFSIPKLTKSSKKKKKTPNPVKEEEKKDKRKKKEPSQWRQWRRKKKIWSKVAADPDHGFLHVYLIIKMLLKTELCKLKTAKMCFQFP